MNQLRALVVVATLIFASGQAIAGVTAAKVQRILVFEGGGSGGMAYVYPVGGVTNAPACHGSNGDYYSFRMDRVVAKEYLSLLLAAQAMSATVTFWGKGECLEQSMSETLNYIAVERP